MGEIGGDEEDFAGADGEDTAIAEGKAQRAFHDISDLLVLVAVHGDDSAFAEHEAGEHGAFSIDQLAIDERVEVIDGDLPEGGVLEGAGIGQENLLSGLGLPRGTGVDAKAGSGEIREL